MSEKGQAAGSTSRQTAVNGSDVVDREAEDYRGGAIWVVSLYSRSAELLIEKLIPWPRIRTVHVLENRGLRGAPINHAIQQAKAFTSTRTDARPFHVWFYDPVLPYMVSVRSGTISLSMSEAQLSRRKAPTWVRLITPLASSLAMSRHVIWGRSIFERVVEADITSLELVDVHIPAHVSAETGLPSVESCSLTWATIWSGGWPRLVALPVTRCGYVWRDTGSGWSYARMLDEQVGTHTLQNDAHALARLREQIQHVAAHRPHTEAAGVALQS
jgi:hypothetical protein